MSMILSALLAFFLGSYVGKFMGFTVHFLPQILLEDCEKGRLPRDIFKSYFKEPFCWHCKHPLKRTDQLPLIGYFLQKGTCRQCGKPIESKVIWLEWGIALLFGLSALVFPFNFSLLFVLFATCLLICCIITDYEYGILPDQFTLLLLWMGLLGSLFPVFIAPREAILGAIAGYGFFWVINLIYYYFRNIEGMFPGDFKINAAIGALVGLKLLFPILLISLLLVIVVALVKVYLSPKLTDTGHFITEYLHKEIAYGCLVSLVAIVSLFLLLAGFL